VFALVETNDEPDEVDLTRLAVDGSL
jgi:hypothetical protein